MAKYYEVVYTTTITKIIAAENIDDAVKIADDTAPKGNIIATEVFQIKSRQQYKEAKNNIATQFDLPILLNT
jgi:hypothetical protein